MLSQQGELLTILQPDAEQANGFSVSAIVEGQDSRYVFLSGKQDPRAAQFYRLYSMITVEMEIATHECTMNTRRAVSLPRLRGS